MTKHLVLITTSYPKDNDGSEAAGAFVRDFALELSNKSRVSVLAPGTRNATLQQGSLEVIRYHAPDKPLSLLKPWNPLHWLPIIQTLMSGYSALKCLLNNNQQVDHILAFWVLPSGAWARKAGKEFGIPYSTWALGSDIWSLGKIPIIHTWLKNVLQNSHQNFADGYQLRDDVQRLSGKPCHFLPSTRNFCLEPPQAASSNTKKNLAFLGRWHHNKGTDILIEALSLLNESAWQKIHMVKIFGGGPLENLVSEGVHILKNAGRPVEVGGYLNREQAQSLFSWCDYVLIPSRIESIPVVFSDAMKAGKPVITTPVGDLERLINHYNCGVLASHPSPRDFAEAINKALDANPEIHANGIRKAAADFSLPAITDTLMTLID